MIKFNSGLFLDYIFSFIHNYFQKCHNGEVVVTYVHDAKKLSIRQKNSAHAVHHGTKVVLNAKHVS
jgi:hypothetical protein